MPDNNDNINQLVDLSQPWEGHTGAEVEKFLKDFLAEKFGACFGECRQYAGEDGQVLVRFFADADSADLWEADATANSSLLLGSLTLKVASGGSDAYALATRITKQPKDTIVLGAANEVKFSYSSYYGGDPTNLDTEPGSLTVSVNGTAIDALARSLTSGQEYAVDLGPYLTAQTNAVALTVANAHGNRRVFNMTLKTVSLSLAFDDSFDETLSRQAGWNLRVRCAGTEATVHLSIDGTEVTTASMANTTRDFTIDAGNTLSAGVHTISLYAENAEFGISTAPITTRFIKRGSANPALCFGKATPSSAQLYSSVTIPYYVYFPTATAGDTAMVTGRVLTPAGMALDESIAQKVTFNAAGESGLVNLELSLSDNAWLASSPVTIELKVGGSTATWPLTITDPGIAINPAPQCKVLLRAAGRSNSDADADSWQSVVDGKVTATVERSANFRLKEGVSGFVDGAFVIPAGRRATVTGCKPFATDCGANAINAADRTGKTVEIEFESASCTDASAKIAECIDNGIGFEVYADRAILRTTSGVVETPYADETCIRLGLVIEGTTRHCVNKTVDGQTELDANLAFLYVNGVCVRILSYGVSPWKQPTAKDIAIGSDDCNVKLYTMRIYDRALSAAEMIANYAFDTPNADDKISIARRNDILDAYGQVDFAKTCAALPTTPYKTWTIPKMPTGKKDWQKVNTEFINPNWGGTADDLNRCSYYEAQHDMALDGTSSLSYPDPYKNWANKHNGTWTCHLSDGTTITLTNISIAEGVAEGGKEDVDKVNFASSEGIFNILAANAYQTIMRGVAVSEPSILTPMQAAQQAENGTYSYRQSLAGFPEIGWLRETVAGVPSLRFLSIYNFVNNKYDGTPYGITSPEQAQMWEVEDNVNFFMEELPQGEWKDGEWNDRLTTLYYARFPKDYGVAESPEEVASANAQGAVMRAFHNYINMCHPAVAERYRARYGRYRQLDSPEKIGDTTFTHDTPDYRRALFRSSAAQFLDVPNFCFYFLFFSGLLGIDSMDKNSGVILTKETINDTNNDNGNEQ